MRNCSFVRAIRVKRENQYQRTRYQREERLTIDYDLATVEVRREVERREEKREGRRNGLWIKFPSPEMLQTSKIPQRIQAPRSIVRYREIDTLISVIVNEKGEDSGEGRELNRVSKVRVLNERLNRR